MKVPGFRKSPHVHKRINKMILMYAKIIISVPANFSWSRFICSVSPQDGPCQRFLGQVRLIQDSQQMGTGNPDLGVQWSMPEGLYISASSPPPPYAALPDPHFLQSSPTSRGSEELHLTCWQYGYLVETRVSFGFLSLMYTH